MAQLDPEPRRNGESLGVPGSLEVEAKFSDRWFKGKSENRKFLFFLPGNMVKYGGFL